MLRISIFLFLIGAISAADKCADNNYKHHGEECTCSDFCVDNSHCQRNGQGGYSCQCLPCFTYDPDKGHCVHDCRHTTPKPPTTTPEVTGPCENRLVADIYLLFDASNSITATGWRRALNFGTSIIDTFNVSPTDVQFAFGIFSTPFAHQFNLNFSHNKAALAQRVNETIQLKSNTNTGDALKAINDNNYLYAPAFGGERHVRKILVVVTDGQSQDTEKTKAEAKKLRDQGVLVFVVGVGYLNDDELVGIAGESDHVFKVLSYGGLIDILKNLTDKFCGQVTTPPPSTTPKGPCPKRLVADTYLLLDSSNSITAIGWSRALGFASAIINRFNVSPLDVQFAFGIFSTPFKHIFDLNYSYDKIVLTEKVGTTAHLQTNTHTGEALDFINNENYLYEVNLGGGRNVRKILVIVTDGQSQDTEATKAAAKRLQDKGVLTFAVGVGFLNQDELIALAGSSTRVFNVHSYGGLIDILENLTENFCEGL